MANSIDERQRSGPEAIAGRGLPLPEQTFFSDPVIDRARRLQPALQAFLNQPRGEVTSLSDSVAKLRSLLRGGKA